MAQPTTRVTVAQVGSVPDSIYEFLTQENTDGDKNANVDGSTTDGIVFSYIATEIVRLNRMIVVIGDSGTLNPDTYGALTSLTNGIEVKHLDASGNVKCDLTGGVPITENMEWSRFCYDVVINDATPGDGFVSVRWTFAKSGYPLRLLTGEKLAVYINDDLSDLDEQYFNVQGYKEA